MLRSRPALVEHPRMGVFACPGGHVEEHESQAGAAGREVQEETGLAEVRLLEPSAPAMPAGFPATHVRVPLPWWITEMQVPADNHLAAGHVHVDHAWVNVAADPRPATRPAHPFAWRTADEVPVLPISRTRGYGDLAGRSLRSWRASASCESDS